METNNINFVEAKMAFIREFMNSTRPASELPEFIKAFDTCKPNPIDDKMMPVIDTPECIFSSVGTDKEKLLAENHNRPYNLLDKDEQAEGRKKRKGFARKTVTVNDGTKLNVHPAAKMVKVSFYGRDIYYGSIKAAAYALRVSDAAVSKAIKRRGTVNGHEVEFASISDFTKTK